MRTFIEGSLKGLCPFENISSPSSSKERGIKVVRLITISIYYLLLSSKRFKVDH